jgi:hypothetical protein
MALTLSLLVTVRTLAATREQTCGATDAAARDSGPGETRDESRLHSQHRRTDTPAATPWQPVGIAALLSHGVGGGMAAC